MLRILDLAHRKILVQANEHDMKFAVTIYYTMKL